MTDQNVHDEWHKKYIDDQLSDGKSGRWIESEHVDGGI